MTKPKKIIALLALFLFFSSCGYTPIFSKKDVNFSIEKVKSLGNKDVNRKINQALSNYKNKPGKAKQISLIITNSKNITIASKNSKGEAQTNKISVDVNAKIILAENNIVKKNFSNSSIYDGWVNRKESNDVAIQCKQMMLKFIVWILYYNHIDSKIQILLEEKV